MDPFPSIAVACPAGGRDPRDAPGSFAGTPGDRLTFIARVFLLVLALIGLGLGIAGAWLVALSGSAYYLLVGIIYAVAAILGWRGHRSAALLVAAVALLTVPWALSESGP